MNEAIQKLLNDKTSSKAAIDGLKAEIKHHKKWLLDEQERLVKIDNELDECLKNTDGPYNTFVKGG